MTRLVNLKARDVSSPGMCLMMSRVDGNQDGSWEQKEDLSASLIRVQGNRRLQ